MSGPHQRALSLDLDGGTDAPGRLQRNRKDVARRRWGILAKALKSPVASEPSSPTDTISVRRFGSYLLLKPERVSATPQLYEYTAQLDVRTFRAVVSHRARALTAADLMGFNNTGNVCVWPSEEALAYHCLAGLEGFAGRRVLELGAGMSALAGIMVAKYGRAREVRLTDGNRLAVENIQASIEHNYFPDTSVVSTAILDWSHPPSSTVYDVILCADCLFFDDARSHLIETLWTCLAVCGVAMVMAPKRAGTLAAFVANATARGFWVETIEVYNVDVWNRHLECLDNPEYEPDIHYPILLRLTKSSCS